MTAASEKAESGPREAANAAGATPSARLLLRPHEDRRIRGGHPWVFSNEIGAIEGEPAYGSVVDVCDSRGAFLGRGYWNHRSLIAARLLTRGRDTIDTDFLVKRLERAKKFRERVLPGTAAVRLVYGESDQLPGLVVDRYGDVLAVQILTLGMEVRADEIREALQRVFAPRGAWRLADAPLRKLEGLPLERTPWWGEAPERVEVEVEGFNVEVNLATGQKTGLFLDQRFNRRRAEARATGRKVLDLFCYQGEWGLHALRGGAAEVLAVDSSQPALDAAGRNFDRNGFTGRAALRRGQAMDVMRELEREGKRFGMIILDPPGLVKSGKQLAAGARAYRELNRTAIGLLEEEGLLITCSCSHHVDDAMFRQLLLEAARVAKRPMRVLEWAGESPDHPQLLAVPETHYLKCAVLQAL
ncbi:MAG: class I SAM-dependent rRNA methyltransferase [Candidatus Eisenbacteria bacterium]